MADRTRIPFTPEEISKIRELMDAGHNDKAIGLILADFGFPERDASTICWIARNRFGRELRKVVIEGEESEELLRMYGETGMTLKEIADELVAQGFKRRHGSNIINHAKRHGCERMHEDARRRIEKVRLFQGRSL